MTVPSSKRDENDTVSKQNILNRSKDHHDLRERNNHSETF